MLFVIFLFALKCIIEIYCCMFVYCSYEKMSVTLTPQKGRCVARLPEPVESNKANKWYDKSSSHLQTIDRMLPIDFVYFQLL